MQVKKVLYILLSIFLIILFVKIGILNKNKESLILQEGIKTTGVVTNRKMGRDSRGYPLLSISFDFYIGDTQITHLSQRVSKDDYYRSIVGMKYRVKYLDNRPHINSIIFIEDPISSEFLKIKQERQRIKDTYKNADVFLKKNARPLEEIQHLVE